MKISIKKIIKIQKKIVEGNFKRAVKKVVKKHDNNTN